MLAFYYEEKEMYVKGNSNRKSIKFGFDVS